MSVQTLTVGYGPAKKALTEFYLIKADIKFAINNVPFAELKVVANNETYGRLNQRESSELDLLQPGSEITISRDNKLLFSGVVTERICNLVRGVKNITLKAHHRMQAMRALFRSQLFSQQSDADILKAIFNDHKLTLGKVDGLGWKHPQMVQYNCFDWQFVRARLNANAVWLVAGPEKIDIVKPALQRPVKTFSGDEPGKLSKIRIYHSNRLLPKSVVTDSWNIAKQEITSVAAEPLSLGDQAFAAANLNTLSSTAWALNHSLELLPQEQTAWANSRLLALYSDGIQGEIETEGESDYAMGQTLALKNFGSPLDGQALITGVTHSFTRYEWRTQLTLGAAWLQDLDNGMVPRIQGLHVAQIAENKDGPDKNHCLKVALPVLGKGKDGKPLQLLARLSSPFASNESGLNLYPEEKDEVIVAFLEDDPRFPVILGAMHNPQNGAPNAELGKGKGLIIKKGNKTQSLLLDPEKGMIFEEKEGDKLSKIVFKQGTLNGESSETTTLKAKGLVLDSSSTLDASGSSGVTIKGSSVKLNQ
ncbi:phage baseplate assembly protein V [Serratia marcescens]|uniref:phage baseplate assembly protein V n=1 Tax=Serratia marcescens TaxID=615 RepID=UPI003FA69681